jgi:hypothetical protein
MPSNGRWCTDGFGSFAQSSSSNGTFRRLHPTFLHRCPVTRCLVASLRRTQARCASRWHPRCDSAASAPDMCTGKGLTPASSAPGLCSVSPCHVCIRDSADIPSQFGCPSLASERRKQPDLTAFSVLQAKSYCLWLMW